MRPIQENDVFHAIAHPARRAILVTLKDGERAASELAQPFQMTFAAISQHLHILEEAELVSVRRDGRQHQDASFGFRGIRSRMASVFTSGGVRTQRDFPRFAARCPDRNG